MISFTRLLLAVALLIQSARSQKGGKGSGSCKARRYRRSRRRHAQVVSTLTPSTDLDMHSSSSDDQGSLEAIDDQNIQHAVNQWLTNRTGAILRFGPINEWDVSGVTSMFNLFKDAETFDDEISNWDVSCVTTMHGMFWG